MPKWILDELAQAERRPADRDKLRLLVIHEKGQDLGKALVVIRLPAVTERELGAELPGGFVQSGAKKIIRLYVGQQKCSQP